MVGERDEIGELMLEVLGDSDALALLATAKSPSWRQFPAYCKVAARQDGAQSLYLLVRHGQTPAALANVRIKKLPVLGGGLALIAQGPVLLPDNSAPLPAIIDAIAAYLARGMKLTLRINPPIGEPNDWQEASFDGFRAIEGSAYNTFIIDLTQDEDALRASLNGKWRTDLRRGERGPVRITASRDPGDFRLFQPLLAELGAKKSFSAPQDAHFFARVAEDAAGPEEVTIHLAWCEDRLVGGHIGAYSGDLAVYLLGAANDEGRENRAAFLLQMAAMRHAKTRSMSAYDLGGIDEIANPNVYRFKKRMGGELYVGPPMLERRAAWPYGSLTALAETAHRKIKGRGQ
jgi:lipid II:glycine glycyltransferase (peptidoglycan interpeptide bridge formation enzyme)